MRALTKPRAQRAAEHPSDLYRTPVEVIERFCAAYEPVTDYRHHVYEPCAGDGRIGERVARRVGCSYTLTDLHAPERPETSPFPRFGDVLEWERPAWPAHLIVPLNPPFCLLDPIARRLWSEMRTGDELILLISSVSLANNSRPRWWTGAGIMPFHTVWDIRWRCAFETPDGRTMKGAAMAHQWVRAVKGLRIRPGETRQIDLVRG